MITGGKENGGASGKEKASRELKKEMDGEGNPCETLGKSSDLGVDWSSSAI